MDSVSLKVLRRLVAKREMRLCDLRDLLPRKTGDHLDVYPLAWLIKGGYANLAVNVDGQVLPEIQEQALAIDIFGWLLGPDQTYRDIKLSGADFRTHSVFATAKAVFLLDELRQKRRDRWWAVGIPLTTAIVGAGVGAYLKTVFDALAKVAAP